MEKGTGNQTGGVGYICVDTDRIGADVTKEVLSGDVFCGSGEIGAISQNLSADGVAIGELPVGPGLAGRKRELVRFAMRDSGATGGKAGRR